MFQWPVQANTSVADIVSLDFENIISWSGPVRKYSYSRLNTWWLVTHNHVIFHIKSASRFRFHGNKRRLPQNAFSNCVLCTMWRLRWNFQIEIISDAWWRNWAYHAIHSSWAINVYVKVFNLQNRLNFNNTWPCTIKHYWPTPQVEKLWNKGQKSSGAACRRLQTNTEKIGQNMQDAYTYKI